jgi:hypothetical protein
MTHYMRRSGGKEQMKKKKTKLTNLKRAIAGCNGEDHAWSL